MIDLGCTRAALLAEIAARELPGRPPGGAAALAAPGSRERFLVRGHTQDELFPLLEVSLSERFAAVPRSRLIRDLLVPLKTALGNAWKHGNGGDATRSITVEAVLTRRGAVVAVEDEGAGFDAARALERFRRRERYFTNFGAGFEKLERAGSRITWENGGRTLLLGFVTGTGEGAASLTPPAEHRSVFDAEWMRALLSAAVPGLSRIESCRVSAVPANGSGEPSVRYVLGVGGEKSRILTGRLLADADRAAADFDAARRLHEGLTSTRVRVPRPIARLAEEPRLVLYDFDPWMDLSEYAADRENAPLFRRRAERVGQTLAVLHGSGVAFQETEADFLGERGCGAGERLRRRLANRHPEADFSRRLGNVLRSIEERAAAAAPRRRSPIHGRFGLDSVLYGVDGSFYFYRFEACRMSDPGLDLGGFLADVSLLGDEETRRAGSEGFLAGYSSKSRHAAPPADLGLYVALALLDRLGGAKGRSRSGVDELLRLCEESLEPGWTPGSARRLRESASR